jgi:hypothetical protein
MNTLTLIVMAALLLWWYRPLRVYLVQRTNRTVKVLLVVFPLLFVARLAYGVYAGQKDDWFIASLTVTGLIGVWALLVWLGDWLERRRPTKQRGPDLQTLQTLSRLPGMPRIPSAVTNPEVQRAAKAAAETASRVDWGDVAGSMGRTSGRWAARLKRKMADSDKHR